MKPDIRDDPAHVKNYLFLDSAGKLDPAHISSTHFKERVRVSMVEGWKYDWAASPPLKRHAELS